MAHIGITFIPNFMKISQLAQAIKGGKYRQQGDLITLLLFIAEDNMPKTRN
jgi:hypothetical protein